jgi:Contractile injection system tube protein
MTTFSNSPKLIKSGIVLVDPQTLSPIQNGIVPGGMIALQYNPDSLTRTLQASTTGSDGQDRSEAMRLKGPPVETIKLEAEIDATDQLNRADSQAIQHGIQPQLAALEMLVYPSTRQIDDVRRMASTGTLEILPMEAPLSLFIWSKSRIIPVRVTEFSITEEAFDPDLNPIRAKVSLGLRVLNMNDLGFEHRGSDLFSTYQREKESLARKNNRTDFGNLGIGGIG